MKSLFKFLFFVLSVGAICVACIFGIAYIDQNDMSSKAIHRLNTVRPNALPELNNSFKLFSHQDDSPILVRAKSRGNDGVDEHQRIYPSHVIHADKDEVLLYFNGSPQRIINHYGLKELSERLINALGNDVFLKTQSDLIRLEAIRSIKRTKREYQRYNYEYEVELFNGKDIKISKATYEELTIEKDLNATDLLEQ